MTAWLYDGEHGSRAQTSRRFVEDNTGKVRMLTSLSDLPPQQHFFKDKVARAFEKRKCDLF